MSEFAFAGKYIIEADMLCRTGLHIGGLSEGYEIGGIDNVVIKVPVPFRVPTGNGSYDIPAECPYIPGSSLKGKLRSLMEWLENKVKVAVHKDDRTGEESYNAQPHTCGDAACPVCVIFGSPASETTMQGPTRLSVLDAFPTAETIKDWETELGEDIFTEIKPENTIDRLTSQANPRQMERVPAGSRFRVVMVYDVYDEEQDRKLLKHLFQAMKLLQDSYLGGSGSRGSGRVSFENIHVSYRSPKYYMGEDSERKVVSDVDIDSILGKFDAYFSK